MNDNMKFFPSESTIIEFLLKTHQLLVESMDNFHANIFSSDREKNGAINTLFIN